MYKILVITPYFYPDVSGVGKHTYNLCKRLISDHQYNIVVISSGEKYKLENIDGIKVYRLPYTFKISNTPINLFWYRQIRTIIQNEKPDLVNSRGPVPFLTDLGAVVCGDIPFVVGYHFPSMVKGKVILDLIIKVYEKYFLKYMLNKAEKIICSSEYIRRGFLKDFSNKSITITQGLDNLEFSPGKYKTKHSILFVGNFYVDYKGLSYLIRAMKTVIGKFSKSKLRIVGEGNTKYYLQLAQKCGVEKSIEFTGRLAGKKLVREYQKAAVLVLPSVVDNFPSVLLEAMACRTPVIASKVAGVPDIVKHDVNGLLVAARNTKALSDAIIRLFSDTNLSKRLSNIGYENVKNNFSWDSRVELTKNVYEEAIKSRA